MDEDRSTTPSARHDSDRAASKNERKRGRSDRDGASSIGRVGSDRDGASSTGRVSSSGQEQLRVGAGSSSAPPRQWERISPDTGGQVKRVLRTMIDRDSYWSIVTAGVLTLVATCLVLLWAKPVIVLKTAEDGSVEQGRISVAKLFTWSAFAAILVAGIAFYVKWHRNNVD